MSIFSIQGGKQAKPVGSDKDLGFDPCSMSFFPKGDYFVMSGSNKKITLWNREGVLLGEVGENPDWIWSTSVNPKNNNVVSGGNGGQIMHTKITMNQVHGLYQERYAYRELMTDVIIQHLVTETRVKIRCRDYIKKIAIYKDRLAV
jgi:intraflagellar transport protein 122